MLGDMRPTPFDLQFQLFGIPVLVSPTFWLLGVFLGWPHLSRGEADLFFVVLGCLFLSILVHEMGHALSARSFGWPPRIVMYHFGGLALFRPGFGYTTARSVFISFAGPGAGFLLYGAVFGVERWLLAQHIDPGPVGVAAIFYLKWMNLWWGVLNLLPVLPLDGGQICRDLCTAVRPRDGMEIALKIAIVVSGAAAALFLTRGLTFAGVLFGLLCFENFQAYQARRW